MQKQTKIKLWNLKDLAQIIFMVRISFFVADGFQSIFDYQPTLNVSGLKKTQRYWICYWLESKRGIQFWAKGVYSSDLKQLHGDFFLNIK